MATVLGATLLGTTMAAGAKPFGKRGIERIDANGDGQVSLEEFQDHDRGPFARLDADGDGTVSQSELEAHQIEMQARHEEMQEKMREHFDTADANNDGFVTREEARNAAFNRIDTNGDGLLTSDELKAAHPSRGRFGHRKGRTDYSEEG